MAAEAARALDYEGQYSYGSAVPAREAFSNAAPGSLEFPDANERIRRREHARAEAAAALEAPSLSLFALFGFMFVIALMVFVLLAQINYSESAAETARLSAQLSELMEQHRRLEITFESVVSMKEIEQYARDVLGMSRPESYQIAVIQNAQGDRAEVLSVGGAGSLQELGAFISSLFEYFRR